VKKYELMVIKLLIDDKNDFVTCICYKNKRMCMDKRQKVRLSLCCFLLTDHNAMKAYWGEEAMLHAFFDLGTRWR